MFLLKCILLLYHIKLILPEQYAVFTSIEELEYLSDNVLNEDLGQHRGETRSVFHMVMSVRVWLQYPAYVYELLQESFKYLFSEQC